jgi:hypothetical protein
MGRPLLPFLGVATAAAVAWPVAPLPAASVTTPFVAASSGLDPSTPSQADTLLARGGGGGARGGGGRGGGRAGGGGGPARTGFSGGGSFTRGDRRPSGGFSSGDRLNRVGNPSLNRPATRPGGGPQRPDGGRDLGDRRGDLGDRTLNRDGNRSIDMDRGNRSIDVDRGNRSVTINRDWNREVNIGDINLHPGWARPGWGVARPWNWGWYGGWSHPPWGWWGARAAAWGIGTLATAAIINNAVDDAVANDVTYIVVPNSGYQLQFGTVQAYGNGSVSFVVTADGTSWQLSADCNAGTLNGREPASAQEAELLNAACQVAYGEAN